MVIIITPNKLINIDNWSPFPSPKAFLNILAVSVVGISIDNSLNG
jgi:hypothetical protein